MLITDHYNYTLCPVTYLGCSCLQFSPARKYSRNEQFLDFKWHIFLTAVTTSHMALYLVGWDTNQDEDTLNDLVPVHVMTVTPWWYCDAGVQVTQPSS